ncbi:MAG TPA: glycosyltransferase [Candidatus Limnocylindrales bacterium]
MTRVVMFVYNDCKRDQRVLREAGTLASAGYDVTIMARPSDPGATEGDRERRDGFEIVRVPIPSAWRRRWLWFRYPWRVRGWVKLRASRTFSRLPISFLRALEAVLVGLALLPWAIVRAPFYLLGRALVRSSPPGSSTLDWLVRWRFGILGWARAAAGVAPAADVWHGHDLTGLPGAVEGQRRHGGRLVYDSHELFIESGSNARRPWWGKRFLERLERRSTRQADALVTVNRTLADVLCERYGFRKAVVLHNTPERWSPPTERPDLLRLAAGIPSDAPIVLYHGGFSADRGLLPLAEAMLSPGLERAHVVYLGFGDLWNRLVELAAEPRFDGRIHVVPAVPPEELLAWVASADVGVMPNQPATENERLSTPNKLFESLAAGIPVVVSDFPERRRIVIDDPDGPLGAVCDPTDPASIGAAIRSIIELGPEAAADLRRRCLAAAHSRWNWESESRGLLDLYAELSSA